jgi:hypothetical protein
MRQIKSRRGCHLLAATGGLLAAGGSALALDPSDVLVYSAGPVVIRPQLQVAEQFTDNLYYSSLVQRSDFVTVLQPGVESELGQPESPVHVKFTYQLQSLNYAENSQNNSLDHILSLESALERGRLTPETPPRLALQGSDTAQFASSIYGGYSSFVQAAAATNAVTGTLERQLYQLDHRLSYNFSEKTGVYGAGHYDAIDFQGNIWYQDVGTVRGTAGFEYKGLSKTWFFGEAYYGQSAARPNVGAMPKGPHTESIGGFVGARGDFTAKLSGLVKAGYEDSAYGDGTAAVSSPVAEASVNWRSGERTSSRLTYSRHSATSVQWTKTLVTADLLSVQFRQGLGTPQRAAVTVSGSVGFNDYGASASWKNRVDSFFLAGLEFSYQLRLWLRAGAAYEFQTLSSSDKRVVDYQINRVTLSVNVGY